MSSNLVSTLLVSTMLACIAAGHVTKSPDYTGGFVCLRRRLDECQSWWASTLRAMPPWRRNLCALRLVRSKTIDLFSTTSLESQECYLTSTQAFFCTFAWLYNAAASPASRLRSARLSRWQSVCVNNLLFDFDFFSILSSVGSSAGWEYCIVFLGETLYTDSASVSTYM